MVNERTSKIEYRKSSSVEVISVDEFHRYNLFFVQMYKPAGSAPRIHRQCLNRRRSFIHFILKSGLRLIISPENCSIKENNNETGDNMKDIKRLAELYIIYSRCTNMPYICQHSETYDDLLLVCSEKDAAADKIKSLAEQKIPVISAVCKKEQFEAFFTGMYYIGVDGLLFDDGEEEQIYALSDLTEAPDFDKLPNRVYAVHNPSLQISLAYFVQEARRPAPPEEKKNLREMEEEVMVNISRGVYLLPYKQEQNQQQTAGGSRKIEMMSVKDKNGGLFQPLFTDAMELTKFTKGKKTACMIMPFLEVSKLRNPQLKGFVINPMGSNLILNKEQMDVIRKLL